MEYLNFNGKKYLIFGASSGIGKQVAFQLSQLGARLVLVGRNEEKLQETLEMLDGDGHNILICDVSDFQQHKMQLKLRSAWIISSWMGVYFLPVFMLCCLWAQSQKKK